jgi:hypothetical protein
MSISRQPSKQNYTPKFVLYLSPQHISTQLPTITRIALHHTEGIQFSATTIEALHHMQLYCMCGLLMHQRTSILRINTHICWNQNVMTLLIQLTVKISNCSAVRYSCTYLDLLCSIVQPAASQQSHFNVPKHSLLPLRSHNSLFVDLLPKAASDLSSPKRQNQPWAHTAL